MLTIKLINLFIKVVFVDWLFSKRVCHRVGRRRGAVSIFVESIDDNRLTCDVEMRRYQRPDTVTVVVQVMFVSPCRY